MDEDQMARLRSVGYGPALASRVEQCRANGGAITEPMRVLEVHRESLRLHGGDAEHRARVLPRLARSLDERETELAVGDWVLAARDDHANVWVHESVPPLSRIERKDGDGRCHAIVSNVDTALVLMGLDDDFNLRRLERFLALVHDGGVRPVVVLTKADIAADAPPRLERCQAALRARLPGDLDVRAVDARSPQAAEALRPFLGAAQTLVLLGSSGAGKSTLANTLLGAPLQDTGPVREHDQRGKHTTTSRRLLRLPGGACVIDTPGVRALRPTGDAAALGASFSDIESLRGACRFRDCAHVGEPGCAVRATVDPDRLHNYHKLQREMRRDAMTPMERRAQLAQWKVLGKSAKVRLKQKRGEG
jgi:ribosome biogenesis GTPase / thiamine phosphate phosphatase